MAAISAPLGTSPHHFVKFRWERSVRSTAATNIITVTELVANNINNITPGTTPIQTPIGYDQWRTFYTLFEVVSSTITVTVTNTGQQQVNVAVLPSVEAGFTSNFSSFAQAAEQKYATRMLVGPSSGMSDRVRSLTYTTRHMFGAKRNETAPFVTPFGNNQEPQKPWYWGIVVQNASELGVDGFDVTIKASILFTVRLQGKKILLPLATPNPQNKKKNVKFSFVEKKQTKEDQQGFVELEEKEDYDMKSVCCVHHAL
jgi:hypothetical protein